MYRVLAAAVRDEDAAVEILDPDDETFYAELRPISGAYIERACA